MNKIKIIFYLILVFQTLPIFSGEAEYGRLATIWKENFSNLTTEEKGNMFLIIEQISSFISNVNNWGENYLMKYVRNGFSNLQHDIRDLMHLYFGKNGNRFKLYKFIYENLFIDPWNYESIEGYKKVLSILEAEIETLKNSISRNKTEVKKVEVKKVNGSNTVQSMVNGDQMINCLQTKFVN